MQRIPPESRFSRILLPLALATLLFSACSSTRLLETWRAEQGPEEPFHSVYLVGLAPQETERRTFEDEFAAACKEKGIRAQVSYADFTAEESQAPEAVRGHARKADCASILVVHYRGSETREEYVPSHATGYPRWSGYYGYAHDYVLSAGYYVQRRYVYLESRLFATESGELLWSATSRSLEPESVRSLTRDLARLVLGSLGDAAILR